MATSSMPQRAEKNKPARRRKAAAEEKPEPRRISMAGDPGRWYWCNKEGHFVRLDYIGEYGIQSIYRAVWTAPDESFPKPPPRTALSVTEFRSITRDRWLRIIREHAASRHIELPELSPVDDGREFVREAPSANEA
jgi:hypothetical protein